jgi:hypothetical protein
MSSATSASDAVNASLQSGAVESVSDDGQVTLRLPEGKTEVVLIPLEQVVRVRRVHLSRSAP